MANFKTHINWGVIVATIVAVGSLIYFAFAAQYVIAIFFAVIVGSFLPDIDSDTSLPFQIIFGFLSVSLSGFSVYMLYLYGVEDYIFYFAVPITVFIFIRFVLGELFQRFTHHRGIWHSIPAAVLTGLLTIHILDVLYFLERGDVAVYIGGAVSVGYIIHLILDEIYATINFSGGSLLPKRSLGSALKLYSSSKVITIFIYGSIALLFFVV